MALIEGSRVQTGIKENGVCCHPKPSCAGLAMLEEIDERWMSSLGLCGKPADGGSQGKA